jgi:hypothetical protein
VIFADAVFFGHERIHAVKKQKVNLKGAEVFRNLEEAERFRPEIERCEVLDPGIYKKDTGSNHGKILVPAVYFFQIE